MGRGVDMINPLGLEVLGFFKPARVIVLYM